MIRCTECGYKNSPLYHYCGECGAVLKRPPDEPVAAPPPVKPAPAERSGEGARSDDSAPLTGMSFLGLGDSPRPGADYLLEDEPEPRPWGRYILLLLVLGGASLLAWQWRKGGYPFQARAGSAESASPVTQPAPAEQPAPAPQASEPPAAEKQEQPAPSQETAASTPPSEPAPAETKPTETAKPPEPTEEKAATTPAPVARPKPAPPPEPEISPGEALFIQGQRYLYGTGVKEDCSRALKSLLAAAARSHSRAQSTLGAMYSTGHCVNRDLPTAYRWFAKALRQDPSNARLQQNLEVVWRQMTPGERQLALQQD
jgi:Sel1 repeat